MGEKAWNEDRILVSVSGKILIRQDTLRQQPPRLHAETVYPPLGDRQRNPSPIDCPEKDNEEEAGPFHE